MTAELLVYRLVVHLHHDHLVTTVLLSHSLTNIHKQHFHIIKYLLTNFSLRMARHKLVVLKVPLNINELTFPDNSQVFVEGHEFFILHRYFMPPLIVILSEF